MKIEIWSDVVCPFCYIGKQNLEAAVAESGKKVTIDWKSFELDPTHKENYKGDLADWLGQRYGKDRQTTINSMILPVEQRAAEVGLEFNLNQAVPANTNMAHQLIHLASNSGLQNEMKNELLKAYFTNGKDIGKEKVLKELAQNVGLDASEVQECLENRTYSDNVKQDQHHARQLGISGVPFFLIDGKYSISGAQPKEVFLRALKEIASKIEEDAPSCGTDNSVC